MIGSKLSIDRPAFHHVHGTSTSCGSVSVATAVCELGNQIIGSWVRGMDVLADR